MAHVKEITLRRAAALRELASLGCWQTRCADLLEMDAVRVSQMSSEFRISFPKKPKSDTPIQAAVRKGYKAGLSPSQIAEIAGISTRNVYVKACQMGLTKGQPRDPARFRRGFVVPEAMRPQYRELTRILGMSAREAGVELKLIKRPSLEARP